MSPTLTSGDYILITKARSLRPGFVVLVDHPKYGVIVKRIVSIADQSVTLDGDGPESKTTEAMGSVEFTKIRGRARLAITKHGPKRL